MSYYRQQLNVFPESYLRDLQRQISTCNYFGQNNLNRDFINTKGFSVVFRRTGWQQVAQQFTFFETYIDMALLPECNAFYLNPLMLQTGSKVDPHIDRSLRSYCKTIHPPDVVSVLYVQIPQLLQGGELVLHHHQRQVGKITPKANMLIHFQGDLTHSITRLDSKGSRWSLVCEQYCLVERELQQIPEFLIEFRSAKKQK